MPALKAEVATIMDEPVPRYYAVWTSRSPDAMQSEPPRDRGRACMAAKVLHHLLSQRLAPYEADGAAGGVGDALLHGLPADSQRLVEQELLDICVQPGRGGGSSCLTS
jgi:hypothetical protein